MDRALGNPLGNPLGLARAREAGGPRIKSMQRGYVSLGGSLTTTVPINQVNLSNTLFLFDNSPTSTSSDPVLVLTNVFDNQLIFSRSTTSGVIVEGTWTAIEFDGIVAVHRRYLQIASGSTNVVVDLTEVTDKSKCFFVPIVTSTYNTSQFPSAQLVTDIDAFADKRIVLRRRQTVMGINIMLQIVEMK